MKPITHYPSVNHHNIFSASHTWEVFRTRDKLFQKSGNKMEQNGNYR